VSGRWVVDASCVAAYLLGDGSAQEQAAILDEAHAPTLLDVEVTQTLRGLLRGGKISIERTTLALEDLEAVAVRRTADRPLLTRAWELRDRCTIYDGLYVALAEVLEATLLTRDPRLARGVDGVVPVTVVR